VTIQYRKYYTTHIFISLSLVYYCSHL